MHSKPPEPDRRARPRAGPRAAGLFPAAIVAAAAISAIALAAALQFPGDVLPHAALTILFDGIPALALVAVICGAGAFVVGRTPLRTLPFRWRLLLGAAFGLGAMSLAVLLAGLMGVLERTVWLGAVAFCAAASVALVPTLRRFAAARHDSDPSPPAGGEGRVRGNETTRAGSPSPQPSPGKGEGDGGEATRGFPPSPRPSPWKGEGDCDERTRGGSPSPQPSPCKGDCDRFLVLLAVPFLVAALLAACQAPGYLWEEEGFGYDVLEYHLQMPREYFDAGRITYAPHNVYANFPANVEMLYLLAMIVWGDPVAAAVPAQFIHLALAVLTVAAVWLAAREAMPRAGLVALAAAATTGWLVYLSGLAYVENGMLFFGAMALAAVIRALKAPGGPHVAGSSAARTDAPMTAPMTWIALAGLLCGLACGCKYTAAAMFAAPLAAVLAVVQCGAGFQPVNPRSAGSRSAAFPRRLLAPAVFVAATLVSFSPWLIKNAVLTGNPLFPLANRVFDAYPPGWDADSQARWDRGHRTADDERSLAARFTMLWRRVILDGQGGAGSNYRRFGFLILVLGFAGLAGRRPDRVDAALLLVIAAQLIIWLGATHLYARFAVPMIPPLAMLAGRAALRPAHRISTTLLMGVVAAGAGVNLYFVQRMVGHEIIAPGVAEWIRDGRVPGYEYLGIINRQLPPAAHVLMIGDARMFYVQPRAAYTVVFNVNPFAAAVRAARTDDDSLSWLQARGFTHVVFNWFEIERLRRSDYGFPDEIDPAVAGRLISAGCQQIVTTTVPGSDRPWVQVLAVPPA